MQPTKFSEKKKDPTKNKAQRMLQLGAVALLLILLIAFLLHVITRSHQHIIVHIKQNMSTTVDVSGEMFATSTIAAYKQRNAVKIAQYKKDATLIKRYKKQQQKQNQQQVNHVNQNANIGLGVNKPGTVAAKLDLMALMQAPVSFSGNNSVSDANNNANGIKRIFAHTLAHPQWTLFAGTIIPVEISTATSSQLPGLVIGKVLHNVYSGTDADNRHLLIPAGSAILGQGQGVASQTQDRLNVVWNSLRLRLGTKMVRMSLSSAAMGGNLGKTGVSADSVNTHFGVRFGEAALYSIISAGAASVGSGATGYSPANVYQTGVSQSFANAAQGALQRHQNTEPTLSLYQGRTGTIIVRNDLDFFGAYNG